MLKESSLINRCYILRERLEGDAFCDWWRASAIFAASDFLIRIQKEEFREEDIIRDVFPLDAWRSYDVAAPSVVPLIEIDRFEGDPFVVSEYDGFKTLKFELRAGFSVSIEHACRFAIELAEGIDAFHQKKLAYGVLCPNCVALRRVGDRVQEFKIQKPSYATLFAKIPDNRIDDIRGTWGYAAPEFKRGVLNDTRSDIYSLGIILYRLLAGKIPYGSRSGLNVRVRSASPGHIVASLARRGVPRELAAIAVRALRKNPDARYQDCIAFISSLRAFLDARREASIRAGGTDPIADLATLNLKRAQAVAHEITRSLDTVDYFRLISDAALSPRDRADFMEMITAFTMTPEVEELEELEAEGDEDDDSRDVDSYIQEGYERAPPREGPAAPAAELPVFPVSYGAASLKTETPEPAKTPIDSDPFPAVPTAPPLLPPTAPATAEHPTPPAPPESAAPTPRGVRWTRSGGTPEKVAEELLVSLRRAEKGRGAFRFIEDPGTGESAATIRGALERLRREALVVDFGVLPAAESFENSGGNLLGSIIAAVRTEPEGRRRTVIGKLSRLGPWDGTPAYLVRTVTILARKSRPLVLVGYGADAIGIPLHALFADLADLAGHSALCAYFFYRSREVPSWHALSALSEKGDAPTGGPRN